MKILALADIHGNDAVVYMVQEISGLYDFDIIMIAGDITNFGPGYVARDIIDNLPGTVFAVPGNCDTPDVLTAITESRGYNVHMRKIAWQNVKIAGLGGVNGGFNMGITFTDTEAEQFLGSCADCIFLTHQPPFGILDTARGRHIGSPGILQAVKKAGPLLVISGHVHEARGHSFDGRTLFVNPGPAKDGYAAIIDTDTRQVRQIVI